MSEWTKYLLLAVFQTVVLTVCSVILFFDALYWLGALMIVLASVSCFTAVYLWKNHP